MKIIGLTGGIASGKTTVSQMIKKLSIPVVCADELAHQAQLPGKPAYDKIIKEFGTGILNPDKSINRQKLGSIVFIEKDKRKVLNEIVHPEVITGFQKELEKYQKEGKKILVFDLPLLFEAGLHQICDEVVLVYAPEETLKERLAKRDGLSADDIKNRLASQLPIEDKKELATTVIDNTQSFEATRKQVAEWAEKQLAANDSR